MVGVSRAFGVLRLVAAAPAKGLRAADISGALDLHKATASRLLGTLEALGAVKRDRSRRYHISEDFRTLLGVPPSTARLRQAARPELGNVSARLSDTTFLSVRSGLDSLCLERHVGDYAIQALSLSAGSRRPLGVGAGSMALLAWLPEEEQREVIAAQADRLDFYPQIDLATITGHAEASRAKGFTDLKDFVIQGMTGIGMPIRDGSGLVVGAISVAAITERLSGERERLAVAELQAAVARTQARLASGSLTGLDPPGG